MFWAWVTGGWPAAGAAAVSFAVCGGIIVGMITYFPGINPAFVLFLVVIGYVAFVWKLVSRWEREDEPERRSAS